MPGRLRWALAVAALALVALLGGRAFRLGPPIRRPANEPAEPAFLDAVAALYATAGARAKAARDAIEATRQGTGRSDGDGAGAARAGAQLDALAQRSLRNDADLVAVITAVQTIRAAREARERLAGPVRA